MNNPAYTVGTPETDGIVSPPTFLRAMRAVRPELPFEIPFTRLLDGGSDWEYFEHVRPGDVITAVGRVEDIRERTGSIGQMRHHDNQGHIPESNRGGRGHPDEHVHTALMISGTGFRLSPE